MAHPHIPRPSFLTQAQPSSSSPATNSHPHDKQNYEIGDGLYNAMPWYQGSYWSEQQSRSGRNNHVHQFSPKKGAQARQHQGNWSNSHAGHSSWQSPHSRSGAHAFSCDPCGRSFPSESEKQMHLLEHVTVSSSIPSSLRAFKSISNRQF